MWEVWIEICLQVDELHGRKVQKETAEVASASEKRLSDAAAATQELQGQLDDARCALQEAEAKLASEAAVAANAASAAAAELLRVQASLQAETEKLADTKSRLDTAQAQLQAKGGDMSVANETIRLREAALDGVF